MIDEFPDVSDKALCDFIQSNKVTKKQIALLRGYLNRLQNAPLKNTKEISLITAAIAYGEAARAKQPNDILIALVEKIRDISQGNMIQ